MTPLFRDKARHVLTERRIRSEFVRVPGLTTVEALPAITSVSHLFVDLLLLGRIVYELVALRHIAADSSTEIVLELAREPRKRFLRVVGILGIVEWLFGLDQNFCLVVVINDFPALSHTMMFTKVLVGPRLVGTVPARINDPALNREGMQVL